MRELCAYDCIDADETKSVGNVDTRQSGVSFMNRHQSLTWERTDLHSTVSTKVVKVDVRSHAIRPQLMNGGSGLVASPRLNSRDIRLTRKDPVKADLHLRSPTAHENSSGQRHLQALVVKSVSVGNSPPSDAFSQVQLSALLMPQAQLEPVTLAFSVDALSHVHCPAGLAPVTHSRLVSYH